MSEGSNRIPKPKTKKEQVEVDKMRSELGGTENALRILTDMSDEALKKAFTNTREEMEKPLRERIDRLRKRLGIK